MARGPGKARDFDYSNVGTKGRRTGISLKEGRRDEHGMEEVDGLFSSPENSPVELNGFKDMENDSSAGSEGMSMDEGNAPDPMDFLKGTNGSRTSFLPPPAARSPMKTGLTGSPRRTSALQSTPDPQDILESSSPSNGKGFAGAQGESRQDPSPLSTRSVNVGRPNQRNGTQQKPTTKAHLGAKFEPAVIHDFSDYSDSDENANAFAAVQRNFGDSLNVDSDSVAAEELPDSPREDQQDYDDNLSTADTTPPREEPVITSKSTKKAAPKTAKTDKNQAKPPVPRGRPKSQRRNVEEDADPRPTKKRNTTKVSPPVHEPLDPELHRVVENYANRAGPLKGRSLYILKRENPSDNGATHTRSGRVSVRPLAYWRNERCVFGDGEAAEGHRYPLSTIKEVIRTEEQEPEKKKKKGKRSTSHKSKSKKQRDDSSDDDEEVDLWEKEGGVLHGYTLKWDGKTQTSSKEEEVLDIAYAPSGIETREVKDSTFRFAKLLSSSFIGSGVVELPPDGVKKPKNSKKMHMVFYVCHGRVQVDISGVQFSAGKGCVFQVPRGNYYSFANTHRKEARLFFTQGCVPDENENENEEDTPQMSQDAGPESEFEADTPTVPVHVPAKKAKGRPKGKQKKIGK
ncbi:uncharacterized protein N7479_006198 [Penicillium vulpinum]|uniref:CENP-C homolog n=1 Tax=Penicillium vulpinum TaxID=29845 RepID=A0A1V6R9F4_9EURO|nr:uncharacterized protein N7479_006198 [Penicillium vulpinum]KAJ5959048.1 hypothetical protein N7479_006198 [Penicillium vulpinum]OQD97907.1 hypothetical protein PENVUL_c076G04944 [Penicillium vulpinum]